MSSYRYLRWFDSAHDRLTAFVDRDMLDNDALLATGCARRARTTEQSPSAIDRGRKEKLSAICGVRL